MSAVLIIVDVAVTAGLCTFIGSFCYQRGFDAGRRETKTTFAPPE